jgi:hypothetical protein
MVARWIEQYMLAGQHDASEKATAAAKWFADYTQFGSHGRSVTIEDLRNLGLKVDPLEDDQEVQDLVLSVHHATSHTFNGTAAVKIIENHLGRAYIKMRGQVVIPQGGQPQKQEQPPPNLTRAERRRQSKGGR